MLVQRATYALVNALFIASSARSWTDRSQRICRSVLPHVHAPVHNMVDPGERGGEASGSSAQCLTLVVLGAAGDLARKKTYPALHKLYEKVRCVRCGLEAARVRSRQMGIADAELAPIPAAELSGRSTAPAFERLPQPGWLEATAVGTGWDRMRDVRTVTSHSPWRAGAEKPCAPSHRQSPALQTLTSHLVFVVFGRGEEAGLGPPWLGYLGRLRHGQCPVRTRAYIRIFMHPVVAPRRPSPLW